MPASVGSPGLGFEDAEPRIATVRAKRVSTRPDRAIYLMLFGALESLRPLAGPCPH